MYRVVKVMEKGEFILGLFIGWEEKRVKTVGNVSVYRVNNGIGGIWKRTFREVRKELIRVTLWKLRKREF